MLFSFRKCFQYAARVNAVSRPVERRTPIAGSGGSASTYKALYLHQGAGGRPRVGDCLGPYRSGTLSGKGTCSRPCAVNAYPAAITTDDNGPVVEGNTICTAVYYRPLRDYAVPPPLFLPSQWAKPRWSSPPAQPPTPASPPLPSVSPLWQFFSNGSEGNSR